ncbi:hypothetical protein EPA93_15405 [Ktedonosporobacter rubrisoli]|uniref:Uncharacterized protein n=1 Tax=Ktedonosporobacter rubrisoli TaxID=2509675 RepID=A0A4P6JQA3_KTERU|nr:hypothetical protein [Ktedonosporobacter rubrisoli]QBD77302.1 hypothetical protein EPA93_15405 [Ktedonosporobacter rubrisoli]
MKPLPRSLASSWATITDERTKPFPCDEYLTLDDTAYFRAGPVQAPALTVFRWLCQVRVAP